MQANQGGIYDKSGPRKQCLDIYPKKPQDTISIYFYDGKQILEDGKEIPKCDTVGNGLIGSVGDKERKHRISIGLNNGGDSRCTFKYMIQHEFMHALGFRHEHQRYAK